MKPEKLKSGNWRCKVFLGTDPNGKKLFKSITAPTKKEALALAAELACDKTKMQKAGLTVGYCIDAYIREKESELSPHTVQGYKAMAKIRYDSIRDIPIVNLTARDVQILMSDLYGLSHKTKKNVLGLLTASLRYFEQPLDVSSVKIGRQKKEKFAPPSHDCVARLINESKGELKLMIMLGALCGLRRGEVFGLKTKNVDIKKKQIYIDSTLIYADKIYVTGLTKNESSVRTVDLPDIVVEEIKPYVAAGNELVFQTPMNTAMKHYYALRDRLEGCSNIRFHDLRHYYASALVIAGVPDTYAMKMGGWKTPETLRKVYQATFDDHLAKEREKVNNIFNDTFK